MGYTDVTNIGGINRYKGEMEKSTDQRGKPIIIGMPGNYKPGKRMY